MPAVGFEVHWPDGGTETCYSPSTIIHDYFEVGQPYTLTDFLGRCRDGLHAASERVRLRYGGGCSRAMAQLASIEATAKRQNDPQAIVRIERFQTL